MNADQFEFTSIAGEPLTLSDVAGKAIFLVHTVKRWHRRKHHESSITSNQNGLQSAEP